MSPSVTVTVTKLDATSATFTADPAKIKDVHRSVERLLGVDKSRQKLVLANGMSDRDQPVVLRLYQRRDEAERLDGFALADGAELTCFESVTLAGTDPADHGGEGATLHGAYKAFVLSVLADSSSEELSHLPTSAAALLEDRDVLTAAARAFCPSDSRQMHPLVYAPTSSAARWDRALVLAAIADGFGDDVFDYGNSPVSEHERAITDDTEVMAAFIAEYTRRELEWLRQRRAKAAGGSNPDEDADVDVGGLYPESNRLQFASPRLRSDPRFVAWAVLEHGCSLAHATDALIGELARQRHARISNMNGNNISSSNSNSNSAPPAGSAGGDDGEEEEEEDLLLEAMRLRGEDFTAICAAAPALLAHDRALVAAAVASDPHGHALESAAPALRADRAIALAAVRSSGLALECTTEGLRSDPEVALAAARALVDADTDSPRGVLEFLCGGPHDGEDGVIGGGPEGLATKAYVTAAILGH